MDHIDYDSFGQVTWQSSATDQPRFGDAGMRYDPMSGMYWDRFRWYNPQTADFMSPDPIGPWPGRESLPLLRQQPDEWDGPNGIGYVSDPPAERMGPHRIAARQCGHERNSRASPTSGSCLSDPTTYPSWNPPPGLPNGGSMILPEDIEELNEALDEWRGWHGFQRLVFRRHAGWRPEPARR